MATFNFFGGDGGTPFEIRSGTAERGAARRWQRCADPSSGAVAASATAAAAVVGPCRTRCCLRFSATCQYAGGGGRAWPLRPDRGGGRLCGGGESKEEMKEWLYSAEGADAPRRSFAGPDSALAKSFFGRSRSMWSSPAGPCSRIPGFFDRRSIQTGRGSERDPCGPPQKLSCGLTWMQETPTTGLSSHFQAAGGPFRPGPTIASPSAARTGRSLSITTRSTIAEPPRPTASVPFPGERAKCGRGGTSGQRHHAADWRTANAALVRLTHHQCWPPGQVGPAGDATGRRPK